MEEMNQALHTLIVVMDRTDRKTRIVTRNNIRREANYHNHTPFAGNINGRSRAFHGNHGNQDNEERNHINQQLLERISIPKFDGVDEETKPRAWIGTLPRFLRLNPMEDYWKYPIFHPYIYTNLHLMSGK